ncbi:STAS domain-containing protein [Streptomyces sp. NPDC086554]|uniref:STAS domain-containing protein n=1 Tax=Streptomyces sp. NPDC086554 TaxID=3154864 RepID=UPI00343A0EC7
MHDVDDYPQAHTIPGMVVYRYDSPLFFANVEVDITALDSVQSLCRQLRERGIVFALARIKQDLRDDLDAYGLTAEIGEELMFPTLHTAVASYRDWLRDHPPS